MSRRSRARENGVLPGSERAEFASQKTIGYHPREPGTKDSLCRARGDCIVKSDCAVLARVGCPLRRLRRHLPRRGRGYLCVGQASRKANVKNRGIQCSAQDIPMPGGAGIPREVCKIGEVPRPRGGQDAFRGKLDGERCVFPRVSFAPRGRMVSPLRETRRPPWGRSLRLRPVRRASRGTRAGEQTHFCFSSLGEPAPPGSRNCP